MDNVNNLFRGGSLAGGKLKETGTTHWYSPNTGATNESGFTALPGGCRLYSGNFYAIGYYGIWWSSTQSGTLYADDRLMSYSNKYVEGDYSSNELGLSVRCVRD